MREEQPGLIPVWSEHATWEIAREYESSERPIEARDMTAVRASADMDRERITRGVQDVMIIMRTAGR